jgi:hypothetical protein
MQRTPRTSRVFGPSSIWSPSRPLALEVQDREPREHGHWNPSPEGRVLVRSHHGRVLSGPGEESHDDHDRPDASPHPRASSE